MRLPLKRAEPSSRLPGEAKIQGQKLVAQRFAMGAEERRSAQLFTGAHSRKRTSVPLLLDVSREPPEPPRIVLPSFSHTEQKA